VTDTLRCVIFDHSVLLQKDADTLQELRNVLTRLKSWHLKIAVFSTHPMNIDRELQRRSLPSVDLFLTKADVGISKGSHEWVEEAARRLRIKRHQFLYVGDGEWDWRTAINAAILYLHAGWSAPLPPETKALIVPRPQRVLLFASHFLLQSPRWEFALDVPEKGVYVRSLLKASAVLAATAPRDEFRLQDVLTYERRVRVGNARAQDLLLLHALSSLLLIRGAYTSQSGGRHLPLPRARRD
jgi:hypothetical protein